MSDNQTNSRPPIVTILGHVDHGKTTLLDTIRQTKVADREAGGITQAIGASQVITEDKKVITFVDTPGHALFSHMRSRGARVADIAILVVAADDGVMPQTKEAIEYIRKAEVPFIVAITKIDLPNADVERAKGTLEAESVFMEGRGGDTPVVLVSARQGKGIKELLELIMLMYDVSEIKSNLEAPFQAVVIETAKDNRGPVASVIVRDGTMKVGDNLYSSRESAKVRGLFDTEGKVVKNAFPGEAVAVLGLSNLPEVGSLLSSDKSIIVENEKQVKTKDKVLEDGGYSVVIKAQSQGVLEAIFAGLPEKIFVVSSGVGDVTESDVFAAHAAGASIFVFEAKIGGSVRKLADTESVKVESFRVIYEMLDRLHELVKEKPVRIKGKAEILQIFPGSLGKNIAGSRMIEGVFTKKDTPTLMRGEKEMAVVRIVSLKKNKAEVEVVKNGEEFGVYFEPQFDFKPHDVLISLAKE